MKILKNYKVPTGNIIVAQGECGPLEFLSIGDYGKDVNLNQGKNVPDGLSIMPLEEKWVITVSTQYNCRIGCKFCDVPKIKHTGQNNNLTYDDLKNQIVCGLKLHPEVLATKRLNVHFARMGEPTYNDNVLYVAKDLRKIVMPHIGRSLIHPVVSTMMPNNNGNLNKFINDWVEIKNYDYRGDAGLQLSINSTCEQERMVMFNGNSLTLEQISELMKWVDKPKGRKYTLNFAVADYTIDAVKLRDLFDPKYFVVKLTPMHKTNSALRNGIETIGDYTTPYPYEHHKQALEKVGFDVLVFIASRDEDLGRITCGNAILAGTLPHKYEEV